MLAGPLTPELQLQTLWRSCRPVKKGSTVMMFDPQFVGDRRAWLGRGSRRLLLGCLVVISAPCTADEPDDATLQRALATVATAEPEGLNSNQVAQAWKTVAQADYQQLPLIFDALDTTDGLGGNWISMALDRIVERLGPDQLPTKVLQADALNPEHTLLTRRMALDLLARVDDQLVIELQPRLMNDPESELRRPAIEAAIDKTRALAEEGVAKEQLIRNWLDVLSSARDQDQVMQIARELNKLAYQVDLAAQFGYLVDWYVIGPFDNSDGNNYDTRFPPEQLDLAGYEKIVAGTAGPMKGRDGPVSWKKVEAKAANGDVNLNEALEKLRDVLGYGATVFESERAQKVDVRLRIQNSFKIWLNGELLVEQPVGHTGNSFDQYIVKADLRPGKNLLVVKSCQVDLQGSTQFYDNWHFCVRICDATGAAILSQGRENTSGPVSSAKEDN